MEKQRDFQAGHPRHKRGLPHGASGVRDQNATVIQDKAWLIAEFAESTGASGFQFTYGLTAAANSGTDRLQKADESKVEDVVLATHAEGPMAGSLLCSRTIGPDSGSSTTRWSKRGR